MKKVIFTLFTFCLLATTTNAQYCGSSGTSVCTPSGNLNKPGLSPPSDSLPSVVNGTINNTVIQFKNFDTIRFAGQLLTITSLSIDTISNLPTGLCWATNKPNNTFQNKEDGCIKVSGNVCSPPGQYKLHIIVTANVGAPIQTNADAAGLKYYVRVRNASDSETPVDTSQTSANPFIAHGGGANCTSGINDVTSNINSLLVVPNPITNKAVVSFYADKAGVMTERLTNMIGSEVSRKQLDVTMGENKSIIEKGNLPTGVYFYSLSDGKTVATKRVVISE